MSFREDCTAVRVLQGTGIAEYGGDGVLEGLQVIRTYPKSGSV